MQLSLFEKEGDMYAKYILIKSYIRDEIVRKANDSIMKPIGDKKYQLALTCITAVSVEMLQREYTATVFKSYKGNRDPKYWIFFKHSSDSDRSFVADVSSCNEEDIVMYYCTDYRLYENDGTMLFFDNTERVEFRPIYDYGGADFSIGLSFYHSLMLNDLVF